MSEPSVEIPKQYSSSLGELLANPVTGVYIQRCHEFDQAARVHLASVLQGAKSMESEYWMVHCPEHGPPATRHRTEGIARREAERLARENPGRRFFVLHTIASVTRNDVKWEETPAEAPF